LHIISSIKDAKNLEGLEVGVSDWIIVDQKKIDKFAEATGDFQWIHCDQERASQELPSGKTIAHGYLILSLIPALTSDFVKVDNLEHMINFGCNKIRFYNVVSVDSRVRARAKLKQARQRGKALHLLTEVTIDVKNEKKPACVAEILVIFFFK
tara:strand:- start:155 stop:613 length:459 start_codon:yes stop_codon:yes gene_type:complete